MSASRHHFVDLWCAVDRVTVRAIGECPTDLAALAATYGRADLVPVASIGPQALLSMNDPRAQAVGVPGGGAIATAADIASIYQHFLHNRGGALPDDWLADAIGTIRNCSLNVTDGVPANRTIAGYTAGNDGYHLHRWMPAAPRAFESPSCFASARKRARPAGDARSVLAATSRRSSSRVHGCRISTVRAGCGG